MDFEIKKFDDILEDMMLYIIANQEKITDFNEGSVIRSYCEAVGLEVESLYVKAKVGFIESMKLIPYFVFGFAKEGEQYASGAVVFGRTGTTGQITIPVGSLVSTADGVRFETTVIGYILDGNTTSAAISIKAIEAGKSGNVLHDTITIIETPLDGVETVNNPNDNSGGNDEETDLQYNTRFQEYVEGLGGSNRAGILSAAKEVESVRSAKIIEHFPPVSTYHFSLYIEDGAGNAPADMISAVELAIIGDDTETNPGERGTGIHARVLAPTKVLQDVTVEVVSNNILSDELVKFTTKTAIENFINSLELGDDVIVNKLIDVIMGVNGVIDCTITTPASNVSIGDSQIAKPGTVTVTVA